MCTGGDREKRRVCEYSRVSLGNENDYAALGGGEERQQPQGGRGEREHVSVICGISTYHLIDTRSPCVLIGAELSYACLLGPLRP